MRGDQLSRQWQILRQIEVSKNGLTASEIAELCRVEKGFIRQFVAMPLGSGYSA